MWLISLRDLQWRRRRFVTAVAGTALVFAMTLILAGLSATFRNEARRVIDAVGADAWIVRGEVPGPFTSLSVLPERAASRLGAQPGVDRAEPIVVLHQVVRTDGLHDVNVFGRVPAGFAGPAVAEGRSARGPGEAVIDESLGLELGDGFEMGARDFEVVGLVRGLTYYAGQPLVLITLQDAQDIVFKGFAVATAIITQGTPEQVPSGLRAMGPEDVRADLLRPLGNAVSTIDITQALLWVVAASIVGSIIYVSALERVRDFAVLKATGTSTRELMAGLALQAVVLSLSAALLAALISWLIKPLFPLPVEIPARAFATLPVVAVVVGLVASLSGLRRAVAADPAIAFGGP